MVADGPRRGSWVVIAAVPVPSRDGDPAVPRVAARDQGDRGVLRFGRRGEDLGRRGGRRSRPPPGSSGKVLVVTVDPAKRLADALGVEGIGNVERRVPDEAFARAGIEPRGELWAAMLDTKQSWDALVMRHAPDEETAYRILDNRLYENLTARFVQSHDYVAMERLFEIHQTGTYDLIIVDTPPTRNAFDFLDAPARMAEFFGGRLLRWLTAPYRVGGKRGARILTMASRPFYQVADRLLGSQFLQDIAEFFLNFQSMYDGFVERSRAVEALLHDKRTTFACRDHARGCAAPRRASGSATSWSSASSTSARSCLNKTLPAELFERRRCSDRSDVPARRDPAGERALRDRGSRDRGAGADDDRDVVRELRGGRASRGRAAGRVAAAARDRGGRAHLRRRDLGPRGSGPDRGPPGPVLIC